MKLDRRAFLRGALALPLLGIVRDASPRGREATGPRRFVAFFTPNGTENSQTAWRPTGGETDFQLSPILEPLEPFRRHLLVLDGLGLESSYAGTDGEGHRGGAASVLTGAVPGVGGISVDQELANRIGGATRLPSLELSVQSFGSSPLSRISYAAAGVPLAPENDPRAVFDRLFGELQLDPDAARAALRRRHTIFDALQADFAALDGRLGAEDRRRLDEHLTALRELEARLDAVPVLDGACTVPDLGELPDLRDPGAMPAIGRAQMDLLAAAFACDQTRVASLMWSRGGSYVTYPWLGIAEAHHDLGHHADDDADANAKLTAINRWYAEQLAYLAGALAVIPEGDGTVLDHTVILWCNELSKPNVHSRRDMPFVLLGGAAGAFRTGRYLRYPGVAHNDLLVSILHAFGADVTTFGDPRFCTGPLPGLA